MHTLPVTPAQLILSKLISSMVWLLCSILVIALSLGVFFLCGMLNVNGIFSDLGPVPCATSGCWQIFCGAF